MNGLASEIIMLKRLLVVAKDGCSRSRSRSSAGGIHALCIKREGAL